MGLILVCKIDSEKIHLMKIGVENETLEFKKSTSELQSGIISIVSILNKHGRGELYFGVRNDGVAVGQEVSEKSLRDISQAIANHIEPNIFPQIKQIVINDQNCIHIAFEGENTPYFAYGRAYLRVADEDRLMSAKELENYIVKRSQVSAKWDTEISDKTIDDVNEELLTDFLVRANIAGRIDYGYTNKTDVLNKLGLTANKNILNSAKVLYTDSIDLEIQMAIFATNERITFNDLKRHSGNLLMLIELAEKYIRNNIRWRVELDGSIHRKEIPEIPMDAVREALVNSFCHKDYRVSQNNEVSIYKNRIEIYNPGIFPEGLTPDDFIVGSERSIKRNPKIAQLLYYSKDVESFGTGLKRINDACILAGVKVHFQLLKTGFMVVFFRPEFTDDEKHAKKPIQHTEAKTVKTRKATKNEHNKKADKKPNQNSDTKTVRTKSTATSRHHKKADEKSSESSHVSSIIRYLQKNEHITNKTAREILNLADSTIKRIFRNMVDHHLIVPFGDRGQRKYFLKKENG